MWYLALLILILQVRIDDSAALISHSSAWNFSLSLVLMFENKENPIHKHIKLKIAT